MPQSRSLFGQNCVSRNLTGRREKPITVTGKINETSNTGEHSVILKEQNYTKFIHLKSQILKYAILPIILDRHTFLQKNIYVIYILKGKCKEMTEKFEEEGSFDLMHIAEYYANVLNIASICAEKQEYVETFDKRFGTRGGVAAGNIHVRRILMRPEFEIYKIIFNVKKSFDPIILKHIQRLVYHRNMMDVDDIREELINMGYFIDEYTETNSDTYSENGSENSKIGSKK